jgi:tetratricopeptide (TPR) repeat protein
VPEIELPDADPVVVDAVGRVRAEAVRSPRSADAWGRLGAVLLAHGYHAQAEPCLAEAERLAPQEMRWPYYRGMALGVRDAGEATRAFRRALQLGEGVQAVRLRLGGLLLAQGQSDAAEVVFREALEEDPANPEALLGLGKAVCSRGDPAGSLPSLRRATASPRTQQRAWAQLAEACRRCGDVKAATLAEGRAAQFPADPPFPDPLAERLEDLQVGQQATLARASRLVKRNQAGAAVPILRELTRAHPESEIAWLGLGRALLQQGQPSRAEGAFRRAVGLAPDLAEGHFYLGVVLHQEGNPAGAAASFRRATRLRPNHSLAWYNLGHCLKAQGDLGGAEQAWRAALRYKPFLAQAHLQLGELLAGHKKWAEAREHLERAAELDPAEGRARRLLDTLGSKTGGRP